MNIISCVALSLFIWLAVYFDCCFRRIPNLLVVGGMLVNVAILLALGEIEGLRGFVLGTLIGFSIFIPFYLLKGMAAGDVKLMAMVGGFLGPYDVIEASMFTLLVGSVVGLIYLAWKGQIRQFVQRYWLIACSRMYIPAEAEDAARHRFPYAVAIAVGVLLSQLMEFG